MSIANKVDVTNSYVDQKVVSEYRSKEERTGRLRGGFGVHLLLPSNSQMGYNGFHEIINRCL